MGGKRLFPIWMLTGHGGYPDDRNGPEFCGLEVG
jgi:hypothetical protein